MDGAHGLLLDEEACSLLDQQQRAEFLFQWLRHLKKLLLSLDRVRAAPLEVTTGGHHFVTFDPASLSTCRILSNRTSSA